MDTIMKAETGHAIYAVLKAKADVNITVLKHL